jgi:hypothetical protein
MLCLRKNICFHLWDRVGESYCCVYDIFLFCTHVQEDFEDTKGVIKIHKSQMYRQRMWVPDSSTQKQLGVNADAAA